MIKKIRLLIFAAIALTIPVVAMAGWSCGIDDSLLPHVYAMQVKDGQLVAYVGPLDPGEIARTFVGGAVKLGGDGNWAVVPGVNVPSKHDSASDKPCMEPPPDEEWLPTYKPAAVSDPNFEQNIDVCTEGRGKRWGGISFYGGEGSWGVGGIVEEDMNTGNTRYYRSRLLSDYSTSHLEYFGDNLWIATASHGECGTGTGIGVLSGYFANDELYADWTLGAGTCGFNVSDMVVHSDSLWISTELGLSKVALSGSSTLFKKFEWTNYVPTGDAENPMREVTCGELYEELLQSRELAAAPPNDDGPPYAVLWGRINKLRSNFAWEYVRKLNGLGPQDPENLE